MRLLIFIFSLLLASAICSCRSSKQMVAESTDSTSVEVAESRMSNSTDEILSLLNSSTEFDVSGITIEFYPPDSAHPDVRAAPKTLSIDNAKARNETNASKHEVSTAAEKDTVNVSISQSTASAQATKSDNKILSPLDWVVVSTIPIAIILLIIAIFITFKKTH